jgi:dethiobiotin synthetase
MADEAAPAGNPVADGRPASRADGRPRRLVLVAGTGTEVGKTWVSARLLAGLRAAGVTVAARKLAQSFDAGDPAGSTDAEVLAAATGESAHDVCPSAHWYEVAMAPPMAATRLGRPAFTLHDLTAPLVWGGAQVGLVESAGGLRSPLADDGDTLDLVALLAPDLVLLVADAGLGTLNAVRLSAGALQPVLGGASLVVVLNRYDDGHPLHSANRAWLAQRDGLTVLTTPGGEPALVALLTGG